MLRPTVLLAPNCQQLGPILRSPFSVFMSGQRVDGQAQVEDGAALWKPLGPKPAAVRRDDGSADGQAQSQSVLLGCVKCIRYAFPVVLLTGAIVVAVQAQPYPMLDVVVKKVIQKYQTSTCQQLAANKAAPPSDMEKRAVQMMRQDPQLRQAFLNQVAAPIVNKLFECGMIP